MIYSMFVRIFLLILLFMGKNVESSTGGGPKTYREVRMHKLAQASRMIGAVGSSISISAEIVSASPTAVSSSSETLASFYAQYPYQKPSDILPFIFNNARKGDTSAVIKAMDLFHNNYPMYNLSPVKAGLLSREVREVSKLQNVEGRQRILELGSFFGYSALHIAMSMGEQCELTMVEGSVENADVARQVLAYGLPTETLKRINLVRSLSSRALQRPGALLLEPPASSKCLQFHDLDSTPEDYYGNNQADGQFSLIFLDHDKESYAPDLKKLLELNLVAPDCTVVADNIIFPGAPGYLEIVQGPGWATRIVSMPFERIGFETQFKEKEDAMSISVRRP